MDRAEYAREWTAMLEDPAGLAARTEVVQVVGDAMAGVGSRLQFSGHLGSDPDRALALVASMGGALAQGARALLDLGNVYAAAALARQLVEVEYLLWTFADDPEDAPRWLHASKADLWERFRPKAMRDRSEGRFRSEEYAAHCDQGGHPSPRGWHLVLEPDYHSGPSVPNVEMVRLDLAQHLDRAWSLLVAACAAIGRERACATYVHDVAATLSAWRAVDQARSIRIPDGE